MDYLVYVTLALGVIATVFFLYVRVKHGGVKGVLTKTLLQNAQETLYI